MQNNTASSQVDDTALIKRWQDVRTQIQKATKDSDRALDSVTLIAVSKTKPLQMVQTLAQAGQIHFGENYLQEASEKITQIRAHEASLPDDQRYPTVWHYIGHIQRNKTRDIAKFFDWVHTVDREVIAKRLNTQRPDERPKLNVLIQVNIDLEDSKSGCLPEDVDALVEQIKHYDRLCLRGLMIIPAKQDTGAFERTKQLFDSIAKRHLDLTHWDTLSMGMSADMTEAIEYGATMVRVGSAIFGARD